MIIATHVIIAILGIIVTTYGYIRPSAASIRTSYVLVALTFASGFYLVVSQSASILHMCLSGIAYLSIVFVGILATKRKLVALSSEQA